LLERGVRAQLPPILVVRRERGGYVRFIGLCGLDRIALDRYQQQFGDGESVWTPNYLYHLTILDVVEVPVSWIRTRTIEGSDEEAPTVWEQWKKSGSDADVPVYTPRSRDDREVDDQGILDGETAGMQQERSGTTVRISDAFRNRIHDIYENTCILTGISDRALVTVAHLDPRSEAPEYAMDLENVVLLNWMHHIAFDAGYFTIDTDRRIRVNPEFDPEHPYLQSSIVDRDGDQIQLPSAAELSTDRLQSRNDQFDWIVR
jgi:hypothetical protein